MRCYLLSISVLSAMLAHAQTPDNADGFFAFTYSKQHISDARVKIVEVQHISQATVTSHHAYTFNKAGILETLLVADGKQILISRFLFIVNGNNDLVQRIETSYRTKKTDTLQFFKRYNDELLVADSVSYLPANTTYMYNAEGRMTQSVVLVNLGLSGNKRVITNYTLNDSGRTMHVTVIRYENEQDSSGQVVSDRKLSYNGKGQLIEESESIHGLNTWMYNKGTISYLYDKAGNVIRINRTGGNASHFTYNKKGLVTSEIKTIWLDNAVSFLKEKYSYTYYH